jgi:hypothetical protein
MVRRTEGLTDLAGEDWRTRRNPLTGPTGEHHIPQERHGDRLHDTRAGHVSRIAIHSVKSFPAVATKARAAAAPAMNDDSFTTRDVE